MNEFPGWSLTAREADVLRELLRGGSNADIAARLGIKRGTVAHHLHEMMPRLGFSSRTRLGIAAELLRLSAIADSTV